MLPEMAFAQVQRSVYTRRNISSYAGNGFQRNQLNRLH